MDLFSRIKALANRESLRHYNQVVPGWLRISGGFWAFLVGLPIASGICFLGLLACHSMDFALHETVEGAMFIVAALGKSVLFMIVLPFLLLKMCMSGLVSATNSYIKVVHDEHAAQWLALITNKSPLRVCGIVLPLLIGSELMAIKPPMVGGVLAGIAFAAGSLSALIALSWRENRYFQKVKEAAGDIQEQFNHLCTPEERMFMEIIDEDFPCFRGVSTMKVAFVGAKLTGKIAAKQEAASIEAAVPRVEAVYSRSRRL